MKLVRIHLASVAGAVLLAACGSTGSSSPTSVSTAPADCFRANAPFPLDQGTIAQCSSGFNRDSRTEAAHARYYVGRAQIGVGEYARAIDTLTPILQLDSTRIDAVVELARAHIGRNQPGDFGQAEFHLNSALSRAPTDQGALSAQAELALKRKQPGDLERAFDSFNALWQRTLAPPPANETSTERSARLAFKQDTANNLVSTALDIYGVAMQTPNNGIEVQKAANSLSTARQVISVLAQDGINAGVSAERQLAVESSLGTAYLQLAGLMNSPPSNDYRTTCTPGGGSSIHLQQAAMSFANAASMPNAGRAELRGHACALLGQGAADTIFQATQQFSAALARPAPANATTLGLTDADLNRDLGRAWKELATAQRNANMSAATVKDSLDNAIATFRRATGSDPRVNSLTQLEIADVYGSQEIAYWEHCSLMEAIAADPTNGLAFLRYGEFHYDANQSGLDYRTAPPAQPGQPASCGVSLSDAGLAAFQPDGRSESTLAEAGLERAVALTEANRGPTNARAKLFLSKLLAENPSARIGSAGLRRAIALADEAEAQVDTNTTRDGWMYESQTCLSRIRNEEVTTRTPLGYSKCVTGRRDAHSLLLRGMFHLKEAELQTGYSRDTKLRDALQTFIDGLTALDTPSIVSPGDPQLLRAQLIAGQGISEVCSNAGNVSGRGQDRINALGQEMGRIAGQYFAGYGVHDCRR